MQIEERTAEKKQHLLRHSEIFYFKRKKGCSFPNVLHYYIKISLAYYRSYFARLTSSSKLRKRKIFPISKFLSTIELNNLLHTILTFIYPSGWHCNTISKQNIFPLWSVYFAITIELINGHWYLPSIFPRDYLLCKKIQWFSMLGKESCPKEWNLKIS